VERCANQPRASVAAPYMTDERIVAVGFDDWLAARQP
jgi:hypothetical protein